MGGDEEMATPNPASTPRADQERLWFNNPVRFADVGLGVKPWRKQEEILNAIARYNYVAVRSCNGSGKTFTAALATLWWLMTRDQAIVITTAPTERQVKNVLWREIRKIYDQNQELIGGSISQTKLEISSDRYAFGFSTNTAERFQGFHHENILIIVDEAAGRSRIRIRRDLGIHDHPKRQDAHDRQPRRTRRHILRRLP